MWGEKNPAVVVFLSVGGLTISVWGRNEHEEHNEPNRQNPGYQPRDSYIIILMCSLYIPHARC
jgi:hypothetical protein